MPVRVTQITTLVGKVEGVSSNIYDETNSNVPLGTGNTLFIRSGSGTELSIGTSIRRGVKSNCKISSDREPVRMKDTALLGFAETRLKITRISPFDPSAKK